VHLPFIWQVNDILDAASLRNEALRLVEDDVALPELCAHVLELTKAVLKKVAAPLQALYIMPLSCALENYDFITLDSSTKPFS
jgi:signal transduction histidine kinase